MAKYIYKYFGQALANIVLSDNGATLKCSLPKDFNDPYELFLTVDFSSDAGALASYQEAIGTIPQLPTTCFSNSPAIAPMWAHYGQNVTGFVIEFDEDELKSKFPESFFKDILYQDEADDGLTEMLHRVHVIGKPRYTYFLQGGVFHAAYFTKTTAWSYEMERRMLADKSEVRSAGDLLLLDVPSDCITTIIAGARSDPALVEELKKRANNFGCRFFKMQIGKTTAAPYFIDSSGAPHTFSGGSIVSAEYSCESCNEPIKTDNSRCSWCQISDEDRLEAAYRNPYRMLARINHLEEYIKSMDSITERLNKSRESS